MPNKRPGSAIPATERGGCFGCKIEEIMVSMRPDKQKTGLLQPASKNDKRRFRNDKLETIAVKERAERLPRK